MTNYYTNIATRYKQLTIQTQGIIDVDTQQMGQQAQDNLGNLQHTLAAKQHSDLPLTAFTQLYNQNQASMQKARYPKDFTTISTNVTNAISTITILPGSMDKLQTLSQVITLMKQGNQDVTALQKNYDDDKNAVDNALTPQDLKIVNQTIDTQNQQATSMFLQAIPSADKGQSRYELSQEIQQLKQKALIQAPIKRTLTLLMLRWQTLRRCRTTRLFQNRLIAIWLLCKVIY